MGKYTGREVACGVYACSPKGAGFAAGFAAEFTHFAIDRGRVG